MNLSLYLGNFTVFLYSSRQVIFDSKCALRFCVDCICENECDGKEAVPFKTVALESCLSKRFTRFF